MTDGSIDPKAFVRLLTTALNPRTMILIGRVRAIADYDIAPDLQEPFRRFHRFITDPQPNYITAWRSDPRTEERWYRPHVDGILHSARGGFAAAHYHAERLCELEAQVTRLLTRSRLMRPLNETTVGLGGTRKMDIEYQSFVLASRRCLDYLAGGLTAYFKTEGYSFRTLPKPLGNKMPAVAQALAEAHSRHIGPLSFILAPTDSVRNRVAHKEFVSAGCINLTQNGFCLVGGGEEFVPAGPFQGTLAGALRGKLALLHACIEDMVDTFIEAATKHAAGESGASQR